MLHKPFDHELYERVCTLTQTIAKDKGILWDEDQAEIAYEILTNDYSSELGEEYANTI